ncbi:MAG: hypothetical protein Q7W45_12335 [Bacteroidota bacterium]|nr:hypothetical protein [Bacteroidota bacterium]MDP3146884.1 hypothetical protein [Bacteroidota bacterium]
MKIKEIKTKLFQLKPENERDISVFLKRPDLVDFLRENAVVIFDEKGNKTAAQFFDQEGNTILKHEHKYDIDNNLIESIYFEEGQLISRINYLKIRTKLLIEYNYRHDDSLRNRIETEFDENENKILCQEFNEKDELQSKVIFKNYEDSLRVEKFVYNSIGTLVLQTLSKYDINNNLIEQIYFDKSNNIERKELYTYDSFNNIIEEIGFRSDGIKSRLQENKYSYDNYNNWIKKIEYYDCKSKSIELREITYFNN